MADKFEITEDFDSSDATKSNSSVSSDWESTKQPTGNRRTFGTKIREKARQHIESFKEERAYRKSPEYRRKVIDRLNQQVEVESAKTKLSKLKSEKRKAALESFGVGGSSFGMGNSFGMGGESALGDGSYKGMDSMLGIGGSEPSPRKSRKSGGGQKAWGGMDDLFGV